MAGKKQAVLSIISSLGLIASVTGKLNQEQVNSLIKNGEALVDGSIVFFGVLQLTVPRLTYGVGVLIPKLIPILEKLPKIIRPDFESEKK